MRPNLQPTNAAFRLHVDAPTNSAAGNRNSLPWMQITDETEQIETGQLSLARMAQTLPFC
jgi:hypothetical protein